MDEVVDGLVVGAAGGADLRRHGVGVGELGQAVGDESVVGADQEQRVGVSGVGELVAVAAGDAFDEAVMSQPPGNPLKPWRLDLWGPSR